MDPATKKRIEELLQAIESGEVSDEQVNELRDLILGTAADVEGAPVTASGAATLHLLAEAADKLTVYLAKDKLGALAASSGVVGRMARRRQPQPSPERATDSDRRAVLVAAGGLDGVREGEQIGDRWTLGEAMARSLQRLDRRRPGRGKVLVASAQVEYPVERRLGEDSLTNAKLIEAVCGPQALVASGGICQPVNVDYSVPTWATADRPLRDGLPSFQATRGGVRFVPGPDIGEWAAATGIWSEATDANPEGATKPVVSLKCGTEQLVFLDAIPTRLGFGNMAGRFAPEQVAANTDLAMAAAARIAENHLLDLIAAQCVKDVTSATVIGATRDLLVAVDQVVAGFRSLHRLSPATTLTAIFPAWVRNLLCADLAREIGHSQNADWNSLAVTDEQIDATLNVHGVNPIWHLDGQPNTVSGGVAQTFPEQKKEEAAKAFPTKMVWYCFVEGSVQFLDGGRLDLGVVRDSTLDSTNDYETFVEQFESVAFRGFTGGALQLVSSLCADGSTAGTRSTEGHCA